MTLQDRIRELVAEKIGEWVSPDQPTEEELRSFADALLEEACKTVCHLCAVGTPFSHEEDLKLTTHNIGTVEGQDYRQCRASAIRSGKGK